MLINQLKKRSARDRTRFGQDHLSQNVAELAMAGSVIAIAQGERQEINLILIETPKGGLADLYKRLCPFVGRSVGRSVDTSRKLKKTTQNIKSLHHSS